MKRIGIIGGGFYSSIDPDLGTKIIEDDIMRKKVISSSHADDPANPARTKEGGINWETYVPTILTSRPEGMTQEQYKTHLRQQKKRLKQLR